MAEPDGNPIPPSPTPAAPPAPEVSTRPSPDLPEALTPAPRINPPSVYNQKDVPAPPAPPVPPAGFSDFLAWMQAFGSNQAAPPPPPVEPPSRGTLSRQEKKFHRQGPEATRAVADRPEVRPSGQPPVIRKRRLKPASVTNPKAFKGLLRRLFLLALLAGAFVLGRMTTAKRNPIPVSAVPHATLDRAEPGTRVPGLIDDAMTAEARLDYAKATGLLQQVQAERSRVVGVDYHLAVLAFEDADLPRAMALLDRSVEKGEEVAACYNLRGAMLNRTSGINRGLEDLETATQVDPFDAKYFYFLGEALRRSGQPLAALKRLRQATDRLRDPTLQSLYELKVRLAQIELGRESEFADQLAGEIRRTPPPIDWLFTAAAVELHRGHFDAASGFLDKLLTQTDQETMNVRLRDYFFYGFANEKALARFYAPVSQSDASIAATAKPTATPLAGVEMPAPTNATPSPAPATSLHP